MTKRLELLKEIKKHAKKNGLEYQEWEGGNHTIIKVGDIQTALPRHREIPNSFAKKILKQLGVK